jgi:hypothetical protein
MEFHETIGAAIQREKKMKTLAASMEGAADS